MDIALCQELGVAPEFVDAIAERDRPTVQERIAALRASVNPRLYKTKEGAKPIARTTWWRWCGLVGVDSAKTFYEVSEIAILAQTAIWFARGGDTAGLETLLIKWERESHGN